MRCIRIETEGETRWINLDQVARATLARHAGSNSEILAVFFSNASDDCTLKIDNSTKANAAAIKTLMAALDASISK